MRPLIQYDLEESSTGSSAHGSHTDAQRPPTKKRKRNHHNAQRPLSDASKKGKAPVQHWDDPGSVAVGMVYDEQEVGASVVAGSATVSYEEEEEYDEGDEGVDAEQEEGEEGEEVSRPLTHEEIWDDSALIDAWNSAEAEYEAYHGISKAWKTEPVKKSPLWYNKPYTASPPKPSSSKHRSRPPQSQMHEGDEPEPDTAPLDFNTFVPTHDPSLASTAPDATVKYAEPWTTAATGPPSMSAPFFVPAPSAKMVSRDEAFNNALSAMYWSGYWTAVYHCQSQDQTSVEAHDEAADAVEDGIEEDEVGNEEEQDLVPTQR